MNLREITQELLRLSEQLERGQTHLEFCVKEEADAENEYRKARATAYLATSGTVGEREASVDKTVANERHRAHLAAGKTKAALESVRNRRSQLSCLQTVAAAHRAEAEFARTGPQGSVA